MLLSTLKRGHPESTREKEIRRWQRCWQPQKFTRHTRKANSARNPPIAKVNVVSERKHGFKKMLANIYKRTRDKINSMLKDENQPVSKSVLASLEWLEKNARAEALESRSPAPLPSRSVNTYELGRSAAKFPPTPS